MDDLNVGEEDKAGILGKDAKRVLRQSTGRSHDAAELRRRYRRRAETGERHPGHLDQSRSDTFDAAKMERLYRPLDIGEHILDADTTDFKEDDFSRLLNLIESLER